MLIDSEKLKADFIEEDNYLNLTTGYGLGGFLTILNIIDQQKEVVGWRTDKPEKMGFYPVAISKGGNIIIFFDLWLGKKWGANDKGTIAWYKLPPYEERKRG